MTILSLWTERYGVTVYAMNFDQICSQKAFAKGDPSLSNFRWSRQQHSQGKSEGILTTHRSKWTNQRNFDDAY